MSSALPYGSKAKPFNANVVAPMVFGLLAERLWDEPREYALRISARLSDGTAEAANSIACVFTIDDGAGGPVRTETLAMTLTTAGEVNAELTVYGIGLRVQVSAKATPAASSATGRQLLECSAIIAERAR